MAAILGGSHPVNRTLVYLGNASYSIYLTHFLLMFGYARILKDTHLLDKIGTDTQILLGTAITIAFTAALYPSVELPLKSITRTFQSTFRT
jgi:peptidoglycan/LPS O-acetylase OafA/YrhL